MVVLVDDDDEDVGGTCCRMGKLVRVNYEQDDSWCMLKCKLLITSGRASSGQGTLIGDSLWSLMAWQSGTVASIRQK